MEQLAAAEGLDYDAATARLREWVDAPIQLDPPYPVGAEAVQVLTVHQAKGLEFPVVVLWDGRCQWDTRVQPSAWRMERDGRGWVLNLDGLTWEEPTGLALRNRETQYLKAERRRLVYVAATRARDLLVLPRAGAVAPGKHICGDLLDRSSGSLVREFKRYPETSDPIRTSAVGQCATPEPAEAARVQEAVSARWIAKAAEARRPRFKPSSVSAGAESTAAPVHLISSDGAEPALSADDMPDERRKPREGRFGSLFGQTVHQAIGLVLREPACSPEAAVRSAATETSLTEYLEEAVADVARAIEVLAAEGLTGPLGPALRLEYPVAGTGSGGLLLAGYVDLVGVSVTRVTVVDFKTDAPPPGAVEDTYPPYAAQVRAYGQLLSASLSFADRQLRCGLLFTADGQVRWL